MGEHHGDFEADSLKELLGIFTHEPMRPPVVVVYRPMEDAEEYDDYLFEFLYDCRGWAIFIDEVDRFCNPHKIPKRFKDLCQYRRHRDIDLILVARRAANVHRDLSALASRICVFSTHEPADLDYISKAMGKRYAEECRKLEPHQWLERQFPPERL